MSTLPGGMFQREEELLPPADYEESEGEDSGEELRELGALGGQRSKRERVRDLRGHKGPIKGQKAGYAEDGEDLRGAEGKEVMNMPMLDRFALQERERQERILQRRVEKIEQEKMANLSNISINNGSMQAHHSRLTRHKPDDGRIKLEERARIMMEEKLMREEAERRKKAEALKQQEMEACTFKPKLNKSKKQNFGPRIPTDFLDQEEKENIDEEKIRPPISQYNTQKPKQGGSKSPEREVEREDRVREMCAKSNLATFNKIRFVTVEMMRWGENRDKKVYEKVIAEEAALAEMRGTKKLPLKDIEKLGERMYAAQQALEKKRKAQAEHDFVTTCTFKPAINPKSLELAQQKKRKPITEVPPHHAQNESRSKVPKNRSKSPGTGPNQPTRDSPKANKTRDYDSQSKSRSKSKALSKEKHQRQKSKLQPKAINNVPETNEISSLREEVKLEVLEPASPEVAPVATIATQQLPKVTPSTRIPTHQVKQPSVVKAQPIAAQRPSQKIAKPTPKVATKPSIAPTSKPTPKPAHKQTKSTVVAAIKHEASENEDNCFEEEEENARKQTVLEELGFGVG